MKNSKKILAVMLAAAMLFSLTACSSGKEETKDSKPAAEEGNTQEAAQEGTSEEAAQEPEAQESAGKSEGFKIGYISPGPDTWYLRAEEGAKWACEKAGAEFLSVNSNRDSEQEQTTLIIWLMRVWTVLLFFHGMRPVVCLPLRSVKRPASAVWFLMPAAL